MTSFNTQVSRLEAGTNQHWNGMVFENSKFHELSIEERNKFRNWHALVAVAKGEDLPEIPTELCNIPYNTWCSLTEVTQNALQKYRAPSTKQGTEKSVTNNALIAVVAAYTLDYDKISGKELAKIFQTKVSNIRQRVRKFACKPSAHTAPQRALIFWGEGDNIEYKINWVKLGEVPEEYLSAEALKQKKIQPIQEPNLNPIYYNGVIALVGK